jgi:hypothetical protein
MSATSRALSPSVVARLNYIEPTAMSPNNIELTILMPCLNEALTLETCIKKATAFLIASGVTGELLIADNGSTDGSQSIAKAAGARVVPVARRGYGAALIAGIDAARGRYIIMGDSDDSYDFSSLQGFVDELRRGTQLVMGNRFRGSIAEGAMPFLHRYLGNPVLSFIGRLFFKSPVGDFHCGLRGFDRAAISKLGLRCEGMEFASEMIVKASLHGLAIGEVPTTLAKDGRDRPPHLRTWRDGWRHLRFLLLFTPRWLFLYPGIALTVLGIAQLVVSLLNPHGLGRWPVGIHTQLFAAAAIVIGYQTTLFALGVLLARDNTKLSILQGREQWGLRFAKSASLPFIGAVCSVAGFSLCLHLALQWGVTGFGTLQPEEAMRQIIPGVALLLIGTQSLIAALFFAALRSAFEALPRSNATPDARVSYE